MPHKSYQQYCGIAAALDVVGDRWTLLILRELSFGEQRFTDLRAGLPGIATNLLTERLRDLEAAGLVEQRELPPPAARTVYALTADQGRRVVPVLRALARFGLPLLGDPQEGTVRPRTAVYGGLAALLDPVTAAGHDLSMRFELDGVELWLEVQDGQIVRADRNARPDLTFTGSAAALVELCRGTSDLEAVAPRLHVTGSHRARALFAELFGVREASTGSTTAG